MKTLNTPTIFGPSYVAWRKLQHGQEEIIRFGKYREHFEGVMRHQNGHEHRCSVSFLFQVMMARIRPYCALDELLLTRCINHHDEPEGISKTDLPANLKTDLDDLNEYYIFERLYEPIGDVFWKEMRRAFLLQFCLKNPPCFPADAKRVMEELARHNRDEALFFDGVQRLDYMYYALECFHERGIVRILKEVSEHQIDALDRIAKELRGFGKVVWTPEMSDYFRTFAKEKVPEPIIKMIQLELALAA